MFSRLLAVALVALVTLIVACGGGGEPGETPTAAPSGDEARARAIALGLEDLPAGFALRSEKVTVGGEAAADPEEAQLLQEWGRLLKYDAIYSRATSPVLLDSGGTIDVFVMVQLFAEEEGASKAFVDMQRQRPSAVPDEGSLTGRLRKIETRLAPDIDLGRDSYAYRTTAMARPPGSETEVPFVAYILAVQRGPAIQRVITGAYQGPTADEELKALLARLAERMEEASR